MTTHFSRAGRLLGAIGIVCALTPGALTQGAAAQDLRPAQALLESGLFFGLAEAEAVYGRLDAGRPKTDPKGAKILSYWEASDQGFGQGERAGRMGSGGGVKQMRFGADYEPHGGLVVGASAGVGIGGVGSGELGSQAITRHADVYSRFDSGKVFLKTVVGASQFSFNDIRRAGQQSQTSGYGLRAGAQFGGSTSLAGVILTPTASLTATGHRLVGFCESGDALAARFDARNAGAVSSSIRLGAKRDVQVGHGRAINLEAFVAADEILAFQANALRAKIAGDRIKAASFGAPNGRGLVGGLGIGTTIAEGVTFRVNADYSERDGVSTRTGRARLGVSF